MTNSTTDVPVERCEVRETTVSIEQLTEHQYRLLKRLANSPVKVYCMPAGIDSDKKRDELNLEFNAVLRLVELGLLTDASDWARYKPMVDEHMAESGRVVVIVVLTKLGQRMFERTPWEKRKN